MAGPEFGAAAGAVLAWYRRNRRELPFRGDADPYRVWVSEVMLQQTRVEAMRGRYRDFVARFPDLAALAAAPLDEVLAAWAGLGYYGRARSLHRAARRAEAAGGVPTDAAGWRELPGVGEYTAAAVASICHGERMPAVDGNARRVLARLFAVPGVLGRTPFERRARRRAEGLLAAAECPPGEWNQALMEFGALVCTPKSPRCGGCPLRGRCRARALGRAEAFPRRPPRPRPIPVRRAQGVVLDDLGRMLVFRRREAPLRGLYELPGGECRDGESPAEALVRGAKAAYGIALAPGRPLPPFRHAVMQRRITVFTMFAERVGDSPADSSARFVAPAGAASLPAGSVLRKTAALLPGGPSDRAASGVPPVDTLPAAGRKFDPP